MGGKYGIVFTPINDDLPVQNGDQRLPLTLSQEEEAPAAGPLPDDADADDADASPVSPVPTIRVVSEDEPRPEERWALGSML